MNKSYTKLRSLYTVPGIIVTANQKGGVGKTTVNLELAAYMVQQGDPVLFIDTDPNATATQQLTSGRMDAAHGSHFFRAFRMYMERSEDSADPDAIMTAVMTEYLVDPERGSLYLLNGGHEMDAFARYLATIPNPFEAVGTFFRLMVKWIHGRGFKWVIVDTSPSDDLLTQCCLASAEWIQLITVLQPLDVQGLLSTFQALKKLQRSIATIGGFEGTPQKLFLVRNRDEKRRITSRELISNIDEMEGLGIPVGAVIPKSAQIETAQLSAATVGTNGGGAVKNALAEIYQRITEGV